MGPPCRDTQGKPSIGSAHLFTYMNHTAIPVCTSLPLSSHFSPHLCLPRPRPGLPFVEFTVSAAPSPQHTPSSLVLGQGLEQLRASVVSCCVTAGPEAWWRQTTALCIEGVAGAQGEGLFSQGSITITGPHSAVSWVDSTMSEWLQRASGRFPPSLPALSPSSLSLSLSHSPPPHSVSLFQSVHLPLFPSVFLRLSLSLIICRSVPPHPSLTFFSNKALNLEGGFLHFSYGRDIYKCFQ